MSESSPLAEREAGKEKGRIRHSFRFVLNKRARLRESPGLYARAMRTNVRECTPMCANVCEYSSFFAPAI